MVLEQTSKCGFNVIHESHPTRFLHAILSWASDAK